DVYKRQQEGLHVSEAERYTILSPEERNQGLAQARENISPSGISGFFRSVLNTIIGWFSSDQAQLNSARALLAKPTTQLTAATNFMTRFNVKIEGVGVNEDFAPMTFKNFDQYIEALRNDQVLIKDIESETGFTPVTPSQSCENRQDGLEMQFFMLGLKEDLIRLAPQVINVGNNLRKYLALTTDKVLYEVQKTVCAWRKAIRTVGATVSDAEFRGIVIAASQKLGETVNRPKFVETQAIADWAQMGQQNFVNEAAQQFAQVVKTLKKEAPKDQEDQNMEALTTLLASIDTRARELSELLSNQDTNTITDDLLAILNKHEGFRAALKTVQDELKEVVRTNQDVAALTQETMDAMLAGQTGIIEAEKTLTGTPLKGEAAIAGSFRGLLDPKHAMSLLMAGGMSEEEAKTKVAVDFQEHAKRAVDTFTRVETALANTIYKNDAVIAEGERKAEIALEKLQLLNQFISEDNKDEMDVDPEIETDPINLPDSKKARQVFIAGELREVLLERFEALAGNTDEEAHATLLKQLIVQLGPEGTKTVLGAQVDMKKIFTCLTTRSGQNVAHSKRELLTFADAKDGKPRGIDQLRSLISENRAALEQSKAERRKVEEAVARLRSERQEESPSRVIKDSPELIPLEAQIDKSDSTSLFSDREVKPQKLNIFQMSRNSTKQERSLEKNIHLFTPSEGEGDDVLEESRLTAPHPIPYPGRVEQKDIEYDTMSNSRLSLNKDEESSVVLKNSLIAVTNEKCLLEESESSLIDDETSSEEYEALQQEFEEVRLTQGNLITRLTGILRRIFGS
ncbi:MAG: hypothetical protein P0S93_00230, partial [Candidatus Neptunochlamydia sp.]|nr:hypothetical protein [Candidatus Neptunochlamydia sp.]